MTISRQMRIILMVLTFVLLFVVVGSFYMTKVKPLQTQISSLEESIKVEQDVIAQFEGEKEKPNEDSLQDTTDLQKKIPVMDNMEQFLLMLEEAEVVSKSLIRNATFSQSSIEGSEESTTLEEDIEQLEEENQKFNETTTDIQEEGATEAVEGQDGDPEQAVALPDGVEKLTANLTIEADHYFEMATFVKEIEKFERVTNIESLQFTGYKEVTALADIPDDPTLTYNLTVSTYFFPSLEEFKDEAPKYNPDEPGDKDNPLYQLEEIPEILLFKYNLDNEPYDQLEQNGIMYHVYKYKVEKGDTLGEIANVIYGDSGETEFLRRWNDLKGKMLMAGTTLLIPIEIDVSEQNEEETNIETGNENNNNPTPANEE